MIRRAVAADEARVVALWQSCGLLVPANDPRAEFRFALAGPSSEVLLAEEGGLVVASAMVGHDGHRGWMSYLAVSPSHRLRGLGRTMVRACEGWMAARGVPKARLLIRDGNEQVARFYERLGYRSLPASSCSGFWARPGQVAMRAVEPSPAALASVCETSYTCTHVHVLSLRWSILRPSTWAR